MERERQLGLFGATALGVGAIVGGVILALAGVAFATTEPSAIMAFGLNGAIALLTATSFARLARRFPESGRLYTYPKKVLSIRAFLAENVGSWWDQVRGSRKRARKPLLSSNLTHAGSRPARGVWIETSWK